MSLRGAPGLARRLSSAVALALALIALTPTGALADAAGPTNYRSVVTGFEPAVEGVSAEVFGGDAFIEVTVESGHELVVAGYEDDPAAAPYLRIDQDGNVYVNRRSRAAFLNAARYGSRDVTEPPGLDPEAPPAWEQVATGGSYAWHDHRIHWMSPSTPPQVDEGAGREQPVFEWSLPVLVDGELTTIKGTLVWLPPRSSVPPLVVGVVGLAVAALLVRRSRTVTVPLLAVAGLIALGLGWAQQAGAPPGAEADLLLTALPMVAIGAGGLAQGLRSRGERTAVLLAVLGTVPLLVWGALQPGVLTAPVLPGDVPDPLLRYGFAAVVGMAAGTLFLGGLGLIEPLEDPATAS